MGWVLAAGPPLSGTSDGRVCQPFPLNPNGSSSSSRLKPRSWIVRTEVSISSLPGIVTWSNVRKEMRKKLDPLCSRCKGSGRVECCYCQGRGRTNCVDLAMLPKGQWPKWCKVCGGSGLDYCSRCLGTGEHRDSIGFHFLYPSEKKDFTS